MDAQLKHIFHIIKPSSGNIKTITKNLFVVASLFSINSAALAGWEVQWIDKFEGDSVNWENWTAQTEANYNNEVQCYTDDDRSSDKNYDVSDGTLKIIARKKSVYCSSLRQYKTWTSGRLNSKDKKEFLYGRIESRIRFRNLEAGTWPAFWMLENRISEQPVKGDGDNIGWPNEGASEIDIWEWFSNEPNTYITNFFNTVGNCGGLDYYNYPNGSADVLEWHDYAMEWGKDQISFYIDNTLVVTQDMRNCDRYEEPMFILLNVAMGGNLGGNIDSNLQRATMEVDYVAHCQASNSSSAKSCNESTPEAIDIPATPDTPNTPDTPIDEPIDKIVDDAIQSSSSGGGSLNFTLLLCLALVFSMQRLSRLSSISQAIVLTK